MSLLFVCEPCRQALGIAADSTRVNKIRKPLPQVDVRASDGKPTRIERQLGDVHQFTMAGCRCDCARASHDPYQCNGLAQFRIGGRPGSGFGDKLAARLGAEPIPDLVVSLHQECEVQLNLVLARWFAATDAELPVLESEIERMRYDDRVKLLRDVLQEERPDLMADEPFTSLISRMRQLGRFRNQIAHSRPIGGDYFTRVKRDKGVDTVIRLNADELAEQLDGAMYLVSALSFMPEYLDPEARARQAALREAFEAHRAARNKSA